MTAWLCTLVSSAQLASAIVHFIHYIHNACLIKNRKHRQTTPCKHRVQEPGRQQSGGLAFTKHRCCSCLKPVLIKLERISERCRNGLEWSCRQAQVRAHCRSAQEIAEAIVKRVCRSGGLPPHSLLVTQAWLFNAYVSVLLCRARIGPQAALCQRWAQQEVVNLKTVTTSEAYSGSPVSHPSCKAVNICCEVLSSADRLVSTHIATSKN